MMRKKAVAIEKGETYNQLYSELDTKEGKGKLLRLVKQTLTKRYNTYTTGK